MNTDKSSTHQHTVQGKPTTNTGIHSHSLTATDAALAALEARVAALEGTEPPPDPPAPTPNPSGEAMPTTDLPGWQLLFNDDFTAPVPEGQFPGATGGRWTAYPASWHDTSGNGWYGGPIVSLHDSVMDIFCRYLDGKWQVAAPEPAIVNGAHPRTDVRIAVRFKADPVPGFKTAWLLWPQSNVWPRDGEIDFPEGNLEGTIEAYMHRQGATTGSDQDWRGTSARYTSWHTAVVEWIAGQSCAFYLDGALLAPVITSRVPSTPMRFVLQTETRLSGGPPPAGAQAHVLLDWIAVWGKV